MDVDWKPYKKSFPFTCNDCEACLWEMRVICENCGKKNTIRPTTKADYKKKKKRDK